MRGAIVSRLPKVVITTALVTKVGRESNSEAMIIVNTAVGITERTMRTSWVRPLIPNREVNKNANPAGANNRSITTRRRALELSRENFVES